MLERPGVLGQEKLYRVRSEAGPSGNFSAAHTETRNPLFLRSLLPFKDRQRFYRVWGHFALVTEVQNKSVHWRDFERSKGGGGGGNQGLEEACEAPPFEAGRPAGMGREAIATLIKLNLGARV